MNRLHEVITAISHTLHAVKPLLIELLLFTWAIIEMSKFLWTVILEQDK